MAFDSVINRTGAQSLMPEDVSRDIIQTMPTMSAVMQLARRLPNMSRKQRRMPVLAGLLQAYFVSGDTGLKQASEMSWDNVFINAEELAVIVPIPEAVLDDTDYDIWGEVRPRISEAFGAAFDRAVLFGTNAPSDWPSDILAGATAAANTVTEGTGADLYSDILGTSGVVAVVEEDGFMVNGHVAAISMRGKLRDVRTSEGALIFTQDMRAVGEYRLDGAPMFFPPTDPTYGAFDVTQALMFSGDWNQLVWSIRTDVTYKLLSEAVIQDSSGTIIYNLAQQDMVALRAVLRLGWQLPNPLNRYNTNSSTRYPFGVLLPA